MICIYIRTINSWRWLQKTNSGLRNTLTVAEKRQIWIIATDCIYFDTYSRTIFFSSWATCFLFWNTRILSFAPIFIRCIGAEKFCMCMLYFSNREKWKDGPDGQNETERKTKHSLYYSKNKPKKPDKGIMEVRELKSHFLASTTKKRPALEGEPRLPMPFRAWRANPRGTGGLSWENHRDNRRAQRRECGAGSTVVDGSCSRRRIPIPVRCADRR